MRSHPVMAAARDRSQMPSRPRSAAENRCPLARSSSSSQTGSGRIPQKDLHRRKRTRLARTTRLPNGLVDREVDAIVAQRREEPAGAHHLRANGTQLPPAYDGDAAVLRRRLSNPRRFDRAARRDPTPRRLVPDGGFRSGLARAPGAMLRGVLRRSTDPFAARTWRRGERGERRRSLTPTRRRPGRRGPPHREP